jgi:hypothetical protein
MQGNERGGIGAAGERHRRGILRASIMRLAMVRRRVMMGTAPA